LKTFIDTNDDSLKIDKIIKQLVKVMEYLHQNDISHGDLNLGNILIDPETLKIKIIDF
jgi:serine/threonine protein kinase